MTFLGLDIGERRIGVAVGSSDVYIASPIAVIQRETVEIDARRVSSLAEDYQAERVIIGLPRELDGSIGRQAQSVMDYAGRLQTLVGLPFEYQDERYSTSAALALQKQMGVSQKQGRRSIDAAAAAIILQDFFDTMAHPGTPA